MNEDRGWTRGHISMKAEKILGGGAMRREQRYQGCGKWEGSISSKYTFFEYPIVLPNTFIDLNTKYLKD